MPSASKTKGNSFERDTAKRLSLWWGESFQRTPNSGALRWNGASWTYGDLLPPESFPAVVECKHYKKIDTDAIMRLKPGDGNILGWWLEVQEDAGRCYQETRVVVQPLLVYKANSVPRRLVLEEEFYAAMGGDSFKITYFLVSHQEMPGRFVIVDFEEFLQQVSRELFLEAHRKVIPAALIEHAA